MPFDAADLDIENRGFTRYLRESTKEKLDIVLIGLLFMIF